MSDSDFDIFDMPIGRYPKQVVRTRFAPSPTGMLHIGGVRTALYNYLFAKHHGGQFLLRIEDTDRKRSTQEAIDVILKSMEWLGLDHDEDVVYQASRATEHAMKVRDLLDAGKAYRCYCTQEELAAARQHAIQNHLPQRYNRKCRHLGIDLKRPCAIRLKAPLDGETVLHDLVQGEVRVANSELDDMILLREDGTPTYMLAVVVDDHDMAISHVIRGDDHLTNTFRQIHIYNAFGWKLPEFAHIPLLHAPNGEKLAKRHGAASVLDFQEQGFLPEALCNYLLRLGWGHGDTEIISREDAIKIFDIKDVGKAAARIDYAKLLHVNGVYMRQADNTRLTNMVAEHFHEDRGDRLEAISKAMPALKERAKTIVELCENAQFLLCHPVWDKELVLTDEDILVLVKMRRVIQNVDRSIDMIPIMLKEFAERQGMKLGAVAKPLRLALTGKPTSPPLDSVIYSLGRTECLNRIDIALKNISYPM